MIDLVRSLEFETRGLRTQLADLRRALCDEIRKHERARAELQRIRLAPITEPITSILADHFDEIPAELAYDLITYILEREREQV